MNDSRELVDFFNEKLLSLISPTTNRSAMCFRRVKSFTQRLHLLGSYFQDKSHSNIIGKKTALHQSD